MNSMKHENRPEIGNIYHKIWGYFSWFLHYRSLLLRTLYTTNGLIRIQHADFLSKIFFIRYSLIYPDLQKLGDSTLHSRFTRSATICTVVYGTEVNELNTVYVQYIQYSMRQVRYEV